jgi:hypothetical protein
MMRRHSYAFALCTALILCFSAGARADQQADDLYKQYKSYKAKGQYDLAAKAVCDAAKLDPKYQNECDQVSTYVNGRLQDFENAFTLATDELNRKDCANALRDFAKVSFGPHRDEALAGSAKAKDCLEHPAPVVDPNKEALQAAQLNYANNNFPTADANAQQVKSAELLPQAQAVRNNIRNYNDAMQQGDDFARKKNFTAARQQYEVAAHIKADGPGNPSSKIQQMIAAANPTTGPQQDNKAAMIKAALSDAQSAASKGDCATAIASYTRVLDLDPKQSDAIAGKAKCQEDIAKANPKALEDTLVSGVHAYYDSSLADAQATISTYIKIGGSKMGAAYFYLGATMLSQAFLSNSKSKEEYNRLQQGALDNFRLAKQEKFKPVEKYVSPRILAVWNQAGM